MIRASYAIQGQRRLDAYWTELMSIYKKFAGENFCHPCSVKYGALELLSSSSSSSSSAVAVDVEKGKPIAFLLVDAKKSIQPVGLRTQTPCSENQWGNRLTQIYLENGH